MGLIPVRSPTKDMETHPVADPDSDEIHDIVERSFRTSYSLSPNTIEAILEEWFAPDPLIQRLSRSDTIALVAEQDGRRIGFAEGRIQDSTGTLLWLHVAPDARGQGAGTQLFEELSDALREAGGDQIRARVLAENSEGEEFVEKFGFSKADHTTVEIDNEELVGRVYSPTAETTTPTVPETTTVDGETLVVDQNDSIPGADAEFFPTYREKAREEKGEQYGFYCSNCGTVSETMGELERIKCETCGNIHRPDDWDDAYL